MKSRRQVGSHRHTLARGIVSLEFVLMLPFLLMVTVGESPVAPLIWSVELIIKKGMTLSVAASFSSSI